MLASPVLELPSPWAWAAAYRDTYDEAIYEMGERHLKPLSMLISEMLSDVYDSGLSEELKRKLAQIPQRLNIHEMFSDVMQSCGLREKLNERLAQVPRRRYIEIGEYTTRDDVTEAYKAFVSGREGRSEEGAPQRDPLVAIQCAILYDRHNSVDQMDRRRRRWTYQRLAARFGLRSPRAAKDYVADGRKYLENKHP